MGCAAGRGLGWLAIACAALLAAGGGARAAGGAGLAPRAPSGPRGTRAQDLQRLLPPGGRLEPFPGAKGRLFVTAPLTAPGAADLVALFAAGPPVAGYAAHCTGGRARPHRACRVLVAAPTRAGGLRVLWRSNTAGLRATMPRFVRFTPAATPELLLVQRVGADVGAQIRIVSLAGGRPRVLLRAFGGKVAVLSGARGAGPKALGFWQHDMGASGTASVWRWDQGRGEFVRADGAFPAYNRRLARRVARRPRGAAWVDYFAALTDLEAGEARAALALARAGLRGAGFMRPSPAFYEIEGTVARRRGACARATELYERVVHADHPGGAVGWPALPRAEYGIALCDRAQGRTAAMRRNLRRAVAAGRAPGGVTGSAVGEDGYGFAQAMALLGG